MAEKVADLSSELYLISSHQLCILDRGRRKEVQGVEVLVYSYFMRPSLRLPLEHMYTVSPHMLRITDTESESRLPASQNLPSLHIGGTWTQNIWSLLTSITLEAIGWTICKLSTLMSTEVLKDLNYYL